MATGPHLNKNYTGWRAEISWVAMATILKESLFIGWWMRKNGVETGDRIDWICNYLSAKAFFTHSRIF